MAAPKPNEFVEHILEMMGRFGPVLSKPMFGGWGLYHQGTFFALVAKDALYLKADGENAAEFDALALAPFVYALKDGETIVMSYRAAPVEALEDADVMAQWARSGYAAALRSSVKKRPSKPRAPRTRGDPPAD